MQPNLRHRRLFAARIAELDRVEEAARVPPQGRASLRATFAKPSTNFTDSLPSLFALLSGLWLKNQRGAA
jgi:hypothetical protein